MIHVRVKFPLATYIPMSLYGSLLVSMLCIMVELTIIIYQQTVEADVGDFLHYYFACYRV